MAHPRAYKTVTLSNGEQWELLDDGYRFYTRLLSSPVYPLMWEGGSEPQEWNLLVDYKQVEFPSMNDIMRVLWDSLPGLERKPEP